MADNINYLRRTNSNKQILMFPFAGGHGRSFNELSLFLSKDIEVIGINPPGHMFNSDILQDSISDLVEIYADTLRTSIKSDLILYGHSMGGVVAYEFAKKIGEEKIKAAVFTGSHPPHSRIQEKIDILCSTMNDNQIITRCMEYGGFDPVLRDEKEFCEIFCEIMRADLRALEKYENNHEEQKTNIPLFVLFGSDEDLDYNEASEWNRYFNLQMVKEYPGDHFFIQQEENRKKICNLINSIFNNSEIM